MTTETWTAESPGTGAYADVNGVHLRDGDWDGSGRPEGGHALAVIPGETHYSIFASPLLAEAAVAFLHR